MVAFHPWKTRLRIFGLFFRLFAVVDLNGHVRAHPEAQSAPRTAVGIDFFRKGVPLIVEVFGHAEILLRAKQHTQPASLTAVRFKVNFLHFGPYDITLSMVP
jgi:hypothetical protein